MMTPKHHALLLAYCIQESLLHLGKQGESVISKAIWEYGEQRGRRMAHTASNDNRKNDLVGFLLYGEFDWDDTGNQFKIAHRKPFFKMHAQKCVWHEVWSKENMPEVGRLYCKDIDSAVMKGFNPELNFELSQNMGNGGQFCVFNYHGWQLNLMDLAKYLLLKKGVKKKSVRSWAFHCADVFTVFFRVIDRETKDAGFIIANVIKRFSKAFGESSLDELIHLACLESEHVKNRIDAEGFFQAG